MQRLWAREIWLLRREADMRGAPNSLLQIGGQLFPNGLEVLGPLAIPLVLRRRARKRGGLA
jgi:hypothetical protein